MNSSNTLKSIQEQLICPVMLEPLTEAVTLTPCAHKVQQAAARRMSICADVNADVNGDLLIPPVPCPLCNKIVKGHMVDHTVRELVKAIFGPKQEELNTALEEMTSKLAEESKTVEKKEVVRVPYPGKSARFIHKSGDWTIYDSGADLCRILEFISSTEGSFLKGFSLIGYKDGSVAISLKMEPSVNGTEEYFKQFELFPDSFDLRTIGLFKTKNQDQLRIVFNILAQNNEIPASHFQMIRDIVAAGSHSTEGFSFRPAHDFFDMF